MQRLMVFFIAASCAVACGNVDEPSDDLSSESSGVAQADVQGIPSGCGALLAVQEETDVFEEEFLTVEGLDAYVQLLNEAADITSGESEATTRYLEIMIEITEELSDQVEANPELSRSEAALATVTLGATWAEEIEVLEPETMAYLDRKCEGLIDTSGSLGGTQSDAGEVFGDNSGQDAVAMDGGETETNSQSDQGSTTTTTIVLPPVLDVETTSVGAIGTYKGLEVEVGEIWRTNQEPVDAIAGSGDGTDQSRVMVEVRLSSREDTQLRIPIGSFRWLDSSGTATAPLDGLTLQGDAWNPNLAAGTSERRYLIFADEIGLTEGATLEVFEQGEVAQPIPLALGATTSAYPIELTSGSVGEAIVAPISSCSYAIDTDIRNASVVLDALDGDAWWRAGTGQRLIQIDLGVFVRNSENPGGCPPSIALFQLETRLRLSNGDVVAPVDQNFDTVDQNSTGADRLVFEIPDDVVSMTLVAGGGETLGSWDSLEMPEP